MWVRSIILVDALDTCALGHIISYLSIAYPKASSDSFRLGVPLFPFSVRPGVTMTTELGF